MEKILYATDFSKNAERAFHFALKLAEKHHAELIMLHVFDTPPGWGYSQVNYPIEMAVEANKNWEKSLKELAEQFITDINPDFIAIENTSPVKGILSVVTEKKPDLIVTGTKGKSLLKEIFIGSTTKALVKQSPVPVLAIPNNADYRDFKNILYASDFREIDIEALKKLIELVKPSKPQIKLIHVSSENEYNGNEKMEWFKDLMRESISYQNMSFELLLSDRVFERLGNYIQNHDLDLVVMLEKERVGIIENLFHEDLVWKIELFSSIPILSYNEHYLHATQDQDVKSEDTIEH